MPAWRHVGGLPYQQPLGRRRTPYGRVRLAPGRSGGGAPYRRSAAAWSPRTTRPAGSPGFCPVSSRCPRRSPCQTSRRPRRARRPQGRSSPAFPWQCGRAHARASPQRCRHRAQAHATAGQSAGRRRPAAHARPCRARSCGSPRRPVSRARAWVRGSGRAPPPARFCRRSAGAREARRRPSCPSPSRPARPGHGPRSEAGRQPAVLASAPRNPGQTTPGTVRGPALARRSGLHRRRVPRPVNNRLARQASCTLPHWLRPRTRCRGPPGLGTPSSATVTLTSPAMSWPRR